MSTALTDFMEGFVGSSWAFIVQLFVAEPSKARDAFFAMEIHIVMTCRQH